MQNVQRSAISSVLISVVRNEISKYLHLSHTIKTLKDEERLILKSCAERSEKDREMNAGDVYKSIKESLSIGYTRFYEIIKKMDAMRLINLEYRDGKGRTRIITLKVRPGKGPRISRMTPDQFEKYYLFSNPLL